MTEMGPNNRHSVIVIPYSLPEGLIWILAYLFFGEVCSIELYMYLQNKLLHDSIKLI